MESKCNYYSPLEFPCIVEAGLFISHKGRTSLKYEVGIFKQGSELPSACGHFVHVFVNAVTRKPVELTMEVNEAVNKLLK